MCSLRPARVFNISRLCLKRGAGVCAPADVLAAHILGEALLPGTLQELHQVRFKLLVRHLHSKLFFRAAGPQVSPVQPRQAPARCSRWRKRVKSTHAHTAVCLEVCVVRMCQASRVPRSRLSITAARTSASDGRTLRAAWSDACAAMLATSRRASISSSVSACGAAHVLCLHMLLGQRH